MTGKSYNKQQRQQHTHAPHNSQPGQSGQVQAEVFSFGDPEPVLDTRQVWDYIECGHNGRWYEPPVPFDGLAKSFRANPHHETALRFKRNMLARSFIPSRYMNAATFSAWALDYLIFGNGQVERIDAKTGNLMHFKHALAKYVRRTVDLVHFVYLQYASRDGKPYTPWSPYQFPEGAVFHLAEPDINQEIYGMPEYLSALQSVWLNEAATLFRRKYYRNGSHAGFILYATDAAMNKPDIESMKTALRQSRGPGNFRNLLLYAPGGKKDGLQLIPIGEVAAKDEFMNIKNVSRDDILVPHRVPPQLLGIVPQNSGGFGSIKDAAQMFLTNEIVPLQERFRELNDWAGQKVVDFIDLTDLLKMLLDPLGKGE